VAGITGAVSAPYFVEAILLGAVRYLATCRFRQA